MLRRPLHVIEARLMNSLKPFLVRCSHPCPRRDCRRLPEKWDYPQAALTFCYTPLREALQHQGVKDAFVITRLGRQRSAPVHCALVTGDYILNYLTGLQVQGIVQMLFYVTIVDALGQGTRKNNVTSVILSYPNRVVHFRFLPPRQYPCLVIDLKAYSYGVRVYFPLKKKN